VTPADALRASRRRREAILALLAVALTGFLLFPVLWVIVASFQSTSSLFDPTSHFPPPTLENYKSVFGDQASSIVTSLIVAVSCAAVSLLIAVPAAYALADSRWRWAPLLIVSVLVTQMIPNVMVATPLYLLFNKLGLLNSLPGLVLADCSIGVPFAVLVLRAYFADIPPELREAALMDGAGEWLVLLAITVPVARNAIISAGVFCFLFAWSDFLYALTLDTDGSLTPLSLAVYNFYSNPRIDWGGLMATATLAIIPGALILVAAQRYIAAGLTAGAVKQ
jgi:multiple sugar transport system permease protein